jgi:uncharacterized protein
VPETDMTFAELLELFPGFLIDYDNEAHYRGMAQRRLLLDRCQACGTWIYPLNPTCPGCWSADVTAEEVSGLGHVHTFTFLRHGGPIPGVDFSTPHPIAGIELEEQPGLRYLAQIVNCELSDIHIGMPVRLTWIERAGRPAPAFEPQSPDLTA